jgi:uncharacterized protein (DUF58 family)
MTSPVIAPGRAKLGWAPSSLLRWVEERIGLTVSGLAVLALSVGGWLIARSLGGRTLYLLAYFALVLLGVAVAGARRPKPLSAERSLLPTRARVGQTFAVEFTLGTTRSVATFAVEEAVDVNLGKDVRVLVPSLSSGDGLTHGYTITPRLRGHWAVGPLRATWNDPFGLARGQAELAPEVSIIVHPSTETVFDRPLTRQLQDPPIRPPVTRPWPTGPEFYGMRDYVDGDDLRRIVWRAVARTGRMLVRESEQGVTDRVVVVLDTDLDAHSPGFPSDTFEAGVRVAASVGAMHLREGFSVTLESNSRNLAKLLRGGGRVRIDYLDQLAFVGLEKAKLADAIARVLGQGRRDAHYVVITPRLDAQTAGRLQLLQQAGSSVLLVALTSEDTDRMTVHRATEIGCQVVQVRPGDALAPAFRHAVGQGVGRHGQ